MAEMFSYVNEGLAAFERSSAASYRLSASSTATDRVLVRPTAFGPPSLVVLEGSTETIASLKACTEPAAVDAKLTVYPGVPHDSWTMTYNLSNPENDIYAWLTTHQK